MTPVPPGDGQCPGKCPAEQPGMVDALGPNGNFASQQMGNGTVDAGHETFGPGLQTVSDGVATHASPGSIVVHVHAA